MNAEQFDKHLFNLSQQAAEDSAVPFNEEAWQRMEQLLDGDKKKRRFVLWWWLLPLLLIGGGIAMYMRHYDSNKVAIANKNVTTIINNEVNTNSQSVQTDNKAKEEGDLNTSKIADKQSASSSINKKENVPTTATNTNVSIRTFAKSSQNKPTKAAIGNEQQTALNSIAKNDSQLPSASNSNVQIDDNKSPKNIDFTTPKAELKPDESTMNTSDKTDAQKKVDSAAKLVKGVKKDAPNKKPSFLSKFEVSAFAAADISAVDLSFKEPKSLTFGIGLSYQITKKLSIATGFGVSRKLYAADSADYKNQPWVAASYKLKTVDANCLVYELPINLQYQFAQSKKASWLAVGGVSTYFMKSESYDYNYLWYTQPRKTNYLIEDKNNHLFSILNVAVGYRRQLSKQLSYQLTPFVKIPLTGIGEGQVKLYSAGLQLSVNLKGK